MNIYEKLQQARVILQEKKINKSGQNKFAGYKYYELSDFLPYVNKIMADIKLFPKFDIECENEKFFATMKIIDMEKPEESITFRSPWVEASVKGAQQIQNLGACETYQRRYLYLMALEITDGEMIDAQPNQQPPKTATAMRTTPQHSTPAKEYAQHAKTSQNAKQATNTPNRNQLLISIVGKIKKTQGLSEKANAIISQMGFKTINDLTPEQLQKLDDQL